MNPKKISILPYKLVSTHDEINSVNKCIQEINTYWQYSTENHKHCYMQIVLISSDYYKQVSQLFEKIQLVKPEQLVKNYCWKVLERNEILTIWSPEVEAITYYSGQGIEPSIIGILVKVPREVRY